MAKTKRAAVDPYQDSNDLIPPSTYIPMVREWIDLSREMLSELYPVESK